MNTTLPILAKDILTCAPEGLSKVKFAKIIYFTFKELVHKGLLDASSLKFIRMPLGPVPVGFMELRYDNDIFVKKVSLSRLVYNQENYHVSEGYKPQLVDLYKDINGMVNRLLPFSTSEIVGISHDEPSWKSLVNGEEYFISPDDLARSLPTNASPAKEQQLEDQHLQAKLLEGMIDDIVEESTFLEYPHQEKTE